MCSNPGGNKTHFTCIVSQKKKALYQWNFENDLLYNFAGIELVQDGPASNDDDYSAGDGVKFSLPQPSSNIEGPTVSDTDKSLQELMSTMKSL